MDTRNTNHLRVLSVLLTLLVAVTLAASESLVSRAQENSNSMNMNGSMQNGSMQNSNRGRRGGRRNTTRRNRNMNTGDTNMSGNMNSDMTGDAAGMEGANTNMGGNMNADASGSMQEGNMNMQQGNMNTGGTRRGGRGRSRSRNRRNMNMNSNMDANMNMDSNMNSNMGGNMNMNSGMNSNMSGDSMPSGSMAGSTAADVSGDQTDLSGTYTGMLNFPEMNVNGDSTLTITGNDFTLTTPSGTQSGRVFAVTTRGYTSVAMRFNDAMASGGTSGTPLVVSARARRMGDRLMLSKVPGGREISFMPAGGSMGGSRATRTRRNRRGSR